MSHDHDHSGHDHTHGHDHGGHEHGAHEHHHHEPPAGATNLVTCPVMPGNQVDPAWADRIGQGPTEGAAGPHGAHGVGGGGADADLEDVENTDCHAINFAKV